MIERFLEAYLKRWYRKKRRKPLVLRGARQVGKSTLVRQFARKNGLKLHEINLERYMDLDDAFKTLDMALILRELESVIGANIQQTEELLFLDEIQATPYALQALRYFYEDRPDIPVIAAGSLLEFTLAHHSFSMPVGRIEYCHLGPVSFKEFLYASERGLAEQLSSFSMGESLSAHTHKKLLAKQREYLFVGGMPEAVQVYIESASVAEVVDVQRSIVETYQDDFSKYARQKELALMQRIFRMLPSAIGQKVKYSNLAKEQRGKDVKGIIELLCKAQICHKITHSHCSGLPLLANSEENTYKLLFMDVGIVNYISGIDLRTLNAFTEREVVNEGPLAEQFIGQHLLWMNNERPQLCYWLREARSANAEVDYVVSQGKRIIPLEVKAGKSGSLKSLQQIMLHKQLDFALRFDLNPPSLQDVQHITSVAGGKQPVSFRLLSLPLYMVEECFRLSEAAREMEIVRNEKI